MQSNEWPPLRLEPEKVILMRKAGTSTIVLAALLATGCATVSHPSYSQDTGPTASLPHSKPPLPATESPEQFLQKIYLRYQDNGPGVNFNDDKQGNRVYTPELLALLRQDAAAKKGEVGRLDTDPLIAANDFSVTDLSVKIGEQKGAYLPATASFKNSGDPTRIDFLLVQDGGRWKIADISNSIYKSLKAFLVTPLPYYQSAPAPK